MRIALTAIVYDIDPERKKLARFFDSTDAAGFTDYVIGVDDKSIAGTEEWIKTRLSDADVFSFHMEREDGEVDFGRARNLTLARVPKECAWWGWADADDTIEVLGSKLVPEWLAGLKSDITACFFEYDYLRDDYGNSVTSQMRGRIYRNDIAWEWRDRVHEDCFPVKGEFGIGPGKLHIVRTDQEEDPDKRAFRWVHDTTDRHQGTASKRNLGALRMMLEAEPDRPNLWHSLGNQYFADKRYALAAKAFERQVQLDDWLQRKWYGLIYQSICYRNLEDFDKAIELDTQAMHLCPNLADSYFGLAHSYTGLNDWDRAKQFGELGMQRLATGDAIPDTTVFVNQNHYSFSPYLTLAAAYFNLGDWKTALSAYKQAYKARPEPDLLQRIDHLEWAIDRQRIVHNGIDLAAGLLRRNEPLKALNILSALPAGSDDDPNVIQMQARVREEVAHLGSQTAYQNLYFTQSEHNDPLAENTTDESIAQFMPRLVWTLRRLQAAGVKRVLDVGIGDATPALYFARHGIQVVGIDVDVRRVKEANWNAVKAGFQGTQTLEFDPEGDEEIPEKLELPLATRESMAQFLYCPPGEITPQVEALGPYDAVLALELIEHVPDVEALLALCERMAPRVLLSTPDGSYDGPQNINHGHVRAWGQRDLTRLLVPRGRLVEMHRVHRAPAEQPILVAEYVHAEPLAGAPVTVWCFNTGQDWTPDSIRQGGIGGSETAVIRVAEELAARGKRVTVYAECEGVWNGVRYAFSENFIPQPCELFVSWRSYGPTGQMKDYAEHRWIWCHDVHAGAISEEQLEGVRLIALSNWHKDFLKERYPSADILVSGNGIDIERFVQRPPRTPHRLIFAQSPDRGLDLVLRMFPRIRQAYPDATLDVFYGLDLTRKRRPDFAALIEELAQQPGVTLHGRVDQERLAHEYLTADALIYPAIMPNGEPFTETYCISVVEALAAGCFPITADHGALRETNQGGGFMRIQEDAIRELFAFWERPEIERERMRDHGNIDPFDARMDQSGRRWAVRQTWSKVVDGWLNEMAPTENEVNLEAMTRSAFAG